MASAQELQTWRAQALAAGNTQDVAAIDAELFKLQPPPAAGAPAAPAAPLDDLSPLAEAYADKQHAIAQGAPQDVLDAIDSHIHAFTRKMQEADVGRTLESMGAGGQFLAGAGRGMTTALGHVKELGQELFPFQNRKEDEARMVAERHALEQETAPLTRSFSGEMGNVAGEAAVTAPIALAVPAAAGPVLGGALAGAGTGAVLAEPGERAASAAKLGAAGGVLGMAGKLASVPMEGMVKPSREAKQLMDLGVEGITAGQAAPRSSTAHFEHAAESTGFGASVKAAREELPLNLEHRIIQEAAPPGYTPKLGRDELVADRLSELGTAYRHRYDALIDHGPVPKNQIQHDVLNLAMNPTGRHLTPGDIKTASDVVAENLAKLDQTNSLSTLHNIRSSIGDKARAFQQSNPELAGHYRDVKNALTKHIEGALKASEDPEAFSKLKALDQAYSKYKTVLDAVPLDPGGPVSITPHRLGQAIRNSMTDDAYARGGGGDLRILARAGKMVTSPPRPTTGALGGVLQMTPFAGPWGVGSLGYASSHFPNAYLGQTLPQRVLQKTLGQPVVTGALGQGARVGVSDMTALSPEEKARILKLTLAGQK